MKSHIDEKERQITFITFLFIIYLFGSGVGGACHDICVLVREQLVGVHSLLSLWSLGTKLRSSNLAANVLSGLS